MANHTIDGVFNLPEDIFKDEKIASQPIIINAYEAKMGAFKGKSMLNRNAISLVIHGEKTMHFSKKKVVVTDDEFHFLSAGNCLVTMDFTKQEIFKSILIFFNDKVLTDFYLKYDKIISEAKAKKAITPEPYIAFKKDDFVYNYISSLNLLLKSGKALSTEMKFLKFEELMLHLVETDPDRLLSFQATAQNHSLDYEIRKAVETNITNNLTIEDLAFLCNVSASTFKRRFAKIYGASPNKWLLQQRMEIAANLLQNHHTRPSEVFYQIGYENHSSFTQSFKQAYGITPKEYQLQKLNA